MQLGIDKSGKMDDSGSYIIELENYDEFGKMFAILEKRVEDNIIEQDDSRNVINSHTTDVSYRYISEDGNSEYLVTLQAELDSDIYQIIITQF